MNTAIITVQNVHGYIDESGTAQLLADDIARGLGFVMVRKDRVTISGDKKTAGCESVTESCDTISTSGEKYYTAVRWNTVNKYLRDLDCLSEDDHDVKSGDYIPESWVYLLAMKANNETAKRFQKTVANEILPTLRKTGAYSLKPKAPTPVADMVSDVGATADTIQATFAGVKRGIALAQAIDIVGSFKNFSLESLKQLLPPADYQIGYLNASQVGEKLGLGKGTVAARRANIKLAEKTLQFKDGRNWRLTEDGAQYGEELPFSRNGHSDYQIRWNENVLKILTE